MDWKSNHLGYRVEDYGRECAQGGDGAESLSAAVSSLYGCPQQVLVTARQGYDYATHFGGVLYVFLRGVSPEREKSSAIFRDIPPVEMIDELTECLIQAGG